MSAVKQKLLSLRHTCYKNGYIFAAFLIPVLLMTACYAVFGASPVGNEHSVLALDLNAQYVFYFDYIHDVIRNGESLMYSWSRNLSGEFFGIIGYYLASPFNIIVWLFPREMITEGLFFMMLAKFGACGVTFAIFAHKSMKLSKAVSAIFAPLYAMCAYMVVQTMDPMWLDCVIALPLVCFGIDSLIRENRFRLLAGSLVYCFVANFYIGFMIAIFAVLYFLCRFFSLCEYKEAKARTIALRFAGKGSLFAISGIASALMSAFMLLPVYNSLQNGKFTFTNPDYSLKNNFEIADIFTKLFPNTYDTVRMEGMPFIYCGSIALILAAVYFCCADIPFKRKLGSGVLLGTLAVSMYVRPVDMLWHGGQMPNWLPYRYSFIISFLIVAMAAYAFEKLDGIKRKYLGIITTAYILLIIYIEAQDTVITALDDGGREVFDGITVALPAIFFIAAAGICVYALKRFANTKRLTKTAAVILASVICAELCFNATNTLEKMHKDIVFSTRESYLDVILPLREKVEQIKENDDGFYRIEKNFFRSVNDPMAVNMYGLSHSSSTLNQKAIDMLGYFGFTSNGHYSRFSGNTPLTCDIFGVRYVLSCPDNNTSNIYSADDITAELNAGALPIGYLTSSDIMSLELVRYKPFENQNSVLSAMSGDYGEYFTLFEPDGEPVAKNCTKGNFEGGHIGFTNATGDASVTYNLTVPKSGKVYMYLPTDYQREVYYYVNDSYKGVCFESDNHNIKLLGEFSEGDEIELRLDLKKSDLYYKQPQFAVFDETAEQNAVALLAEKNRDTVVTKNSSTDITFEVTAGESDVLFTTIPAEKGWSVYVDGEQVNYETAFNIELETGEDENGNPITEKQGTLIAIPLSQGYHKVELKFFTAGLSLGFILTAVGIILFVGMIFVYLRLKKPVKLAADTNALTEDNADDTDNSDGAAENADDKDCFADIPDDKDNGAES